MMSYEYGFFVLLIAVKLEVDLTCPKRVSVHSRPFSAWLACFRSQDSFPRRSQDSQDPVGKKAPSMSLCP
jgi:hypothetical protein